VKFKIALLFGSIFLTLSLIEVGLRLFYPQENLYLYQYSGGTIFNKPYFDDLHSMIPRKFFKTGSYQPGTKKACKGIAPMPFLFKSNRLFSMKRMV